MTDQVSILVTLRTTSPVSDWALGFIAREAADILKVPGYMIIEAAAVRESDGKAVTA